MANPESMYPGSVGDDILDWHFEMADYAYQTILVRHLMKLPEDADIHEAARRCRHRNYGDILHIVLVRWSVHSSEKVTCTLGRFGFFVPADARGTLCGAQPGTGAAGATAAGLGMVKPAQLPLKSFPAYAASQLFRTQRLQTKPGAPFLMRRTIVSQIVSR